MESLSNSLSANAPITVAVQKFIKIVSLEPIRDRAMNNAMSPMPKPINPLNASHKEASN